MAQQHDIRLIAPQEAFPTLQPSVLREVQVNFSRFGAAATINNVTMPPLLLLHIHAPAFMRWLIEETDALASEYHNIEKHARYEAHID